jgi:hypothetical protein
VTVSYSGDCTNVSAGGCAAFATFAGDANHASSGDSQSVAIAMANQAITFASPGGKTYGDAPFSVSATASSGLGVSFAASGNCAIAGGAVTLSGAGSCTVTASQRGDPNYNPAADVSQTFAIAKASPTVLVTGGSFTYDSQSHPAGGSVIGVFGEALGTPTFTYNDSSTPPVDAGAYNVIGSFGGDGNYGPATGGAAVTIARASATVHATGVSAVYDAQPHPATGTATGVSGEDLGPLAFTYDGASAAPVNAGTYAVVAAFTGNGNYEASSDASASIVIAKASTTALVASSLNPARAIDAVTFIATIAVIPTGGGVPGGLVEFLDGASVLGTGAVTSSGSTFVATLTSTLGGGSHVISARYVGSMNHAGSTSPTLVQTVFGAPSQPGPPAAPGPPANLPGPPPGKGRP